jgi:NAD(P)-dependent dehydrogenase (short-subunit alcohol dehydrogenase family)
MNEKICLITGANAGIGKAAAIEIAQKGFRVIIGCRNRVRGEEALKEIKAASKNEDIDLLLIDMSSKKSIQDAVNDFAYDHLDVLIHNAADFDISRKKATASKDGVELVWATNHVGPVMLTQLFMDKLKASKHARVVTIASKGLIMHPNLVVDLEEPEFKTRKYSVSRAYYQSKIAQVMYTYWLAEELKDTDITVNCIRVTNVKIDLSRYPNISGIGKLAYKMKSKSALTPERMAKTYTFLATSLNLKNTTGKYFDERNTIIESSKYSTDPANIKKVMDLTMKYL